MSDGSTIQTPFKDAILKTIPMSGDSVKQENGLDIRDGQSGTSRTMPEVTTVNVRDDAAPGRSGGSQIKGS